MSSRDLVDIAEHFMEVTPEHVRFIVSMADSEEDILIAWVERLRAVAGGLCTQNSE